MKKTILILTVAFGLTAMMSCKKDYTCKCTGSAAPATTALGKLKKSDAETNCTSIESTYKLVDPATKCSVE